MSRKLALFKDSFWGVVALVLLRCEQAFSNCWQTEATLHCSTWASSCSDFPWCRA